MFQITKDTRAFLRNKHVKILLLYPKHFGNTGWFLERALTRNPSVYTLSLDLRTYKSGIIGYFKRRYDKQMGRQNSPLQKIAGAASKLLVDMGYTSEPSISLDVARVISKQIDVDLLIHVDGPGAPIVKNLDKVSCTNVLWALDTHLKLNYLIRIAPNYDYVFVAQKRDLDLFRRVNHKSYWLPYAADPTIYKPYNMKTTYDISFVGNVIPGIHDERMELIRRLERTVNLRFFQNKWLDEAAKLYSQSKMIFNKSINGDLNMRVFEALSCGRLLVTDSANGLMDCLEDKKHLAIYKEDSLEELIRYYLGNDKEREKISRNGMQEVQRKHTYDARVTEILDKCMS